MQLVLNGKAIRLVHKSSSTERSWRLTNDDASTVPRSTGDDNGEYWTAITCDGTTQITV
nr:hypothetical protein [Streptomyces parvulus]